MNPIANKEGQPVSAGLAHDSIANITTLTPSSALASERPMHLPTAGKAKERGMSRALFATPLADRQAITAALLGGFNGHQGIRAEDALTAVGFVWPTTASPRSLGAIVSMLARTGQIIETGWTKGRHGRSHAGRVSLWVKVTP